MSNKQMEKDFRRLFCERLSKLVGEITDLCELSGLDERTGPSIYTNECLRLVALGVAHHTTLTPDQFATVARRALEDAFAQVKEREASS